jgi:hypothetical protein
MRHKRRRQVHITLPEACDECNTDQATVIINDGSDLTLDFEISSPPSLADNERLVQDLIHQADSLPKHPDPQQRTYLSGIEIESVLPANNKPERHNEYLTVLRLGKDDGLSGQDLAAILNKVNQTAEEFGFSTTTVMMPASRSKSKRSANPWGTYVLPASDARRQKSEAVLSSNPVPSTSPNTIPDDLESFPVISQADAKDPVLGILPACFDSMTACQKTTNNCSSHGECKLLHKGRGKGKDQESTDCYGCACVPTVKYTDGKGMETKKHVTYWGGPACQKQDISVQFWLFVVSGVVLAFLVASAIGMMFSMGSEELPSVIGAGVSGPVRK